MKRSFRILSALALLTALLLLLSACAGLGGTRGQQDKTSVVGASIAQDGSAWIPSSDYAPAIHIKGDVREAWLCADQAHVLVLEENGELYTANPGKLDKRTEIAQDVQTIEMFRNDGVLYTTLENGKTVYMRSLFADAVPLILDVSSFMPAQNTSSLLYTRTDGTLMLLAADAAEPVVIGSYDGTINPIAVSGDGTLCVWNVTEGTSSTTYLYDTGERQKLNSVDTEYNNTKVYFTQDERQMVVFDTNGSLVHIKKPGEDAVSIELPMHLSWEEPMTASGSLHDASAADTIYVFVETDDYGLLDIYAVGTDGGREKVIGNVRQALFANGRLFYTDESYTLYVAEMKDATVENENKISANVYSIQASPDGKAVCYSKSVSEEPEVGSLYLYSLEKDESVRVTADASFLFIDLSAINSYFIYDFSKFSDNGKYLYYYEDVSDVGDGSYSKGTLCRYSITDGESKTVLMDALTYLGTNRTSGAVSADFFWVEQYFSSDATEVRCDLVLFDKGEKTTLVQSILHDLN